MRAHSFLYESVDPTKSDLVSVAQWMQTTPDNISVDIIQEPIEKFLGQIKEMYSTYNEFPKDARRTNRILHLLKQGATPMPLYVEQNDPDLFVMEGRHRMVAFYLAGNKTVPVAYVSKNEDLAEANIDNTAGWGATPQNTDVDYFGLSVQMRPSTFLKLASPLAAGSENEKVAQHIANGGAIAAPFLEILYPPEWDDGTFTDAASVKQHEGRNRMKAILKVEGDDPIEVHLFLRGGIRRRHITPEMIQAMSQGLYVENSRQYLTGPIFDPGTAQ